MPSVRIIHNGLVQYIPTERVNCLIATRYHGGNIKVVISLDDKPDLTFMVNDEAPQLVLELIGINTVDKACGSITGIPHSNPPTYLVKKGSVGNAIRF